MLFFQIFDGLILVLIVIGALPVVGFLFFQVFSFVLALILWFFFFFLSGFMWLFVLLIEAVIFGWLKLSLCGPPIKNLIVFCPIENYE